MGMNPRLLRPLASGFDPRRIANLTGWWDASDSSTITLNSTTISQWRDKSGNARHLDQSDAANQPTYAATEIGGRPAARLAASIANRMNCQVGGTTNVLMDVLGNDTSQLVTLFAVVKASVDNVANKTIGECDNASGFGWYHRFTGDNRSYFDASGVSGNGRVSGVVSAGILTSGGLWVGRRSGAQVDQWINGTLIAGSRSDASGALRSASNVFCIRGAPGGTVSYAEIIIYNRALSTAERMSVQSYLGQKYGLTIA
jgi:hypothetical protein